MLLVFLRIPILVRPYILRKPRRDEQIPPIGLRQFDGLAQPAQIAATQLECRKTLRMPAS